MRKRDWGRRSRERNPERHSQFLFLTSDDRKMLILGIESSCDDTCAAVLEGDRRVLSSIVSSQEEVHAKYGGIVPELASRRHLECIIPVIREALEEAGQALGQIEAVAVTQGPGLIGSLLVGLSMAKAIAYSRRVPLVPVHHLQGHLFSPVLSGLEVPYPHLGLVVSGGHTSLYRVHSPTQAVLLGGTRDDAAGEAFDKIGKCLELPYPGGPQIEKAAREWSGELLRLPRPRFKTDGVQFSFSGLKTATAQFVQGERDAGRPVNVAQVCQSFQEAVIDCLAGQSFDALQAEGLDALAVSGGVAANGALRRRFEQLALEKAVRVFFADRQYCTDNAAMIAAIGYHKLLAADKATDWPLDLNAYAQLPLGE